MRKEESKPSCSECEQTRELVERLVRENRLLSERLAALEKNSSTSSKPPSSDLVKPRQSQLDSSEEKRSIGGQPGHPRHTREPFPEEQITSHQVHTLDACPCCGGGLRLNGNVANVVQQVDVQAVPLTIEQHTVPEYWCEKCQKPFRKELPSAIQKGGLVGPQLTALIAFMKGMCHASFSTIRKFLRDVVGVTISRGQLSDTIQKVSDSLEQTYEELLLALPNENVLNVDETGHKDNGDRWWTWCFRADLYTVYHIDAHRSSEVLMELLGKDFNGVLGCDYFSAYRKYMKTCDVKVQFCLAHLIRDVKFLTTLPGREDKAYGERLKQALKELFEVIHEREKVSAFAFRKRLERARDGVLKAGMENVPATRHAQNMSKRFMKHGAAYFEFVTTPEVEATNNLAEQAIRFVVIDRHITQGTRSEAGRKWSERIWTIIGTCTQQGKSVYGLIRQAVENWFKGEAGPSLLPEAGA